MVNKSYKKFKKEENSEKKKDKSLSKTLSTSTQRWWGKLFVIILIFGFAGLMIITLIIEIINKM